MKPHRTVFKLTLATWGLIHVHLAFAQSQTSTTNFQYDPNGNLTQIIDGLQNVTLQAYDALNRRVTVAQPSTSTQTTFSYDGLDRIVGVTDPRRLLTSYQIDGLGNLTQQSSPDTGTTVNTFDAAGNVLTSKDAKNQITRFQYDVINRLVSIQYSDNRQVNLSYDQGNFGLGRLTQVQDANTTIQYQYDQRGRLIKDLRTIAGSSYTTSYGYDNAGRLASVTYPSGRMVSYTRDTQGRINSISSTFNGVVTQIASAISYAPFGGIQSFTNGAGRTLTRSYDLDGRISSFSLNGHINAISYDSVGNLLQMNDQTNGSSVHYTYDALNRLTGAQLPSQSFGYTYDATGNRTTATVGAVANTYTIAANSNQVLQVTGGQTNSYSMDPNGSVTSNSVQQYAYDTAGRMQSAVTQAGNVKYVVNPLGQRVQKITPSTSTVYHYDVDGRLIAESSNGQYKEYIYLYGKPVAVFAQ